MLAAMPGNSHGVPRWPAVPDVVLLCLYGLSRLGAQRDKLVGADFEVMEAQARPARAVIDERTELERARVADAQARLDHHHHEVARRERGQLGQVGVIFELGHDELGHETRQAVVTVGELLFVDHRRGGQLVHPVMAPAGVQENPQHAQR